MISPQIKKWLHISFTLFSISLFFFLIGFTYNYHLPKIKNWLLSEIEAQSRLHSPLRLWPKSVDIEFWPLGVSFKEVKIVPQKKLKSVLAPFNINNLQAQISWWGLFKGQLRIGELNLTGANLHLVKPVANESLDTGGKPNINLDFTLLKKIPIDEIKLRQVSLTIKDDKTQIAGKIENFQLKIINLGEALDVNFQSPAIHIKKLQEDPILSLSLATHFSIFKNKVDIKSVQVKKKNSYFVAQGSLLGPIHRLQVTEANINSRSLFILSEATQVAKELFPEYTIPKLQGQLNPELNIHWWKDKKPDVDFNIKSKNLFLNGFEIGNLSSAGQITESDISFNHLQINMSAGTAILKNTKLRLNDHFDFNTEIDLQKFELQSLLKALKVGEIPLILQAQGQIPCRGNIRPKLAIHCDGDIDVNTLNVWNNTNKSFEIVAIEKAKAVGSVNISDEEVSYDAKIKINESAGESSGRIHYKKGFNISYSGKISSLEKDIKNLSGLKLEGSTSIKGRTWGNSSFGRIDLRADTNNLWFEDYGLGQAKFQLLYKNGILTFRDIKAHQGSSRYEGHLSVNLLAKTILVNAKAPFINYKDIDYLLKRKLSLPVDLIGTGSAKIKVSGPLDFKKLNFDLNSSLYRGSIAGESFDQLFFDVTGKKGKIEAKNVRLIKSNSQINLRGFISPDNKIDSVLLGRALRLEQSEILNQFGFDLGGQFDFTMSIRGPLKQPKTELYGRLSKMVVGDKSQADSNFKLVFDESHIMGEGKFIGDVVTTNFNIPYKANHPMSLFIKTNNWDFARLFSIFSGTIHQQAYNTQLTSIVNIKSKSDWLNNANGEVNISHFKAQKGEAYLTTEQPMLIQFKDGIAKTDNFKLIGPSSFLNLDIQNTSSKNLNITTNGKFDMSLLTLFTPFLDDLRGVVSYSLNIKGSAKNPDILGSSYIQDGFVRIKGLVHAFEKMSGDFLFSQKNIIINAIKGEFGGGVLTADGKLSFNSLDDIPINIKGFLTNANLNIPEGFNSKGQAEVHLFGRHMPYTLAGVYNISDGLFKPDFNLDKSHATRIKPSDFLPKFLTDDGFDPLHLNLQVNLLTPIQVLTSINGTLVDTPVEGSIKVTKSPDKPILNGLIKSGVGGEITFRSNIFQLRSAVIEYKNRPPENPDLFITAISNINSKSGKNEDQYQITLDVQGPAKSPNIDLTSQPQLSESDIISLLALGVTTTSFESQLDSDQQALQTGYQVGSQFIKEQLGVSKALEKTGIEFDISSTIDEDESAYKFSFKKQVTPKFGVSLGRTEGNTPSNDLKVEYKFNEKLSVVGQFEKKEDSSSSDSISDSESKEKFGVDLELKLEYK